MCVGGGGGGGGLGQRVSYLHVHVYGMDYFNHRARFPRRLG